MLKQYFLRQHEKKHVRLFERHLIIMFEQIYYHDKEWFEDAVIKEAHQGDVSSLASRFYEFYSKNFPLLEKENLGLVEKEYEKKGNMYD